MRPAQAARARLFAASHPALKDKIMYAQDTNNNTATAIAIRHVARNEESSENDYGRRRCANEESSENDYERRLWCRQGSGSGNAGRVEARIFHWATNRHPELRNIWGGDPGSLSAT